MPCRWLDGKHTVFGKVVEGLDVLDALECLGTNTGDPLKKVYISSCGLFKWFTNYKFYLVKRK